KRLAPRRRRGFFEEKLCQAPSPRLHGIAIEQRHRSHDLGGAKMKSYRQAMLDRPALASKTMQPNGEHLRWDQVARLRDFLATQHIFMMDARQIDGRPLAAMNFLHRTIVFLQRANANP